MAKLRQTQDRMIEQLNARQKRYSCFLPKVSQPKMVQSKPLSEAVSSHVFEMEIGKQPSQEIGKQPSQLFNSPSEESFEHVAAHQQMLNYSHQGESVTPTTNATTPASHKSSMDWPSKKLQPVQVNRKRLKVLPSRLNGSNDCLNIALQKSHSEKQFYMNGALLQKSEQQLSQDI